MSNLSNQTPSENNLPRNDFRRLIKRTGTNDPPLLKTARPIVDSKLENLSEPVSRFVLTKRNDSVVIDNKEPLKRRKGSGPQTKLSTMAPLQTSIQECYDGDLTRKHRRSTFHSRRSQQNSH